MVECREDEEPTFICCSEDLAVLWSGGGGDATAAKSARGSTGSTGRFGRGPGRGPNAGDKEKSRSEETWGTRVVLLIVLALFIFAKANKIKGNSRK